MNEIMKFHGKEPGHGVTLRLEQLRGTYRLENFFHPFVGALADRLGRSGSLREALDPDYLAGLAREYFEGTYEHLGPDAGFNTDFPWAAGSVTFETPLPRLDIDVGVGGPYAGYNWELLFHIPVAIAVHLTKTQRFAEAQRWFHLVFDPSATGGNYWRFLGLRGGAPQMQIDALLRLLSDTPQNSTEAQARERLLRGYEELLRRPFQPFAVARTRHIAFQFMVVMRYLDNLLAWGDSLFAQDTSETVSEATQIYVLGATLLGVRPQQVPTPTSVPARTYAQLKAAGLDRLGNALIDLESQFPFNYGIPSGSSAPAGTTPLFGLVRSLYFCVPRNDRLLKYWDDFADRLGKIRAGMNIAGVIRRLALFDPPIDPALLVRAAAGGVDIGAAVSSLGQPFVPVRASALLQRASELAAEVRNLGSAVLSALEKRDAEDLTLLRQGHELRLLRAQRDIRYLQWKQTEEASESLLRARAATLQRYTHYLRLLGLKPDAALAPDVLPLRRDRITEENFADVHDSLVGVYDRTLPLLQPPRLQLRSGTDAAAQAGAQGTGQLYLTPLEDHELNELLPQARDARTASFVMSTLASILTFIPEFDAKLAFWGLGAGSRIFGGSKMSTALNTVAGILTGTAALLSEQAGMASRTASYERRADDWLFQANVTARELMQQGRQLIASIVAEQAARHEYENVSAQIEDSEEIQTFLQTRFTGRDLQHWMQGELSRLHRAYFDFAIYTARKAESAVKYELMRPELDAGSFVRGDYWEGGRKGLLAAENLLLDVKRLELAYLEHNKYEDVLMKPVSIRRLDPLALLTLQATGSCEVNIPEWLFDLDRPGHYMRRIRSVRPILPAVVGPYAGTALTLTLLRSSIRVSPGGASYARTGSEDTRFKDLNGAVEMTMNTTGADGPDAEPPSLRDQLLPYEGHGVDSAWRIELPAAYRQFDYASIADVVLQVRYTARPGGATLAGNATAFLDALVRNATRVPMAILISVPDEFPVEWDRFVTGNANLQFDLSRDHFPYLTVGRTITVQSIQAYAVERGPNALRAGTALAAGLAAITTGLNDPARQSAAISLPPDAALTRTANRRVFAIVKYTLTP